MTHYPLSLMTRPALLPSALCRKDRKDLEHLQISLGGLPLIFALELKCLKVTFYDSAAPPAGVITRSCHSTEM